MLNKEKIGMVTRSIKVMESNNDNEKEDEGRFDDVKELLNQGEEHDNIINYRLAYINIYYDNQQELVVGIQITFRNLETRDIIPLRRRLGKKWKDYDKLSEQDENYKKILQVETFKINKKEYLTNFSFYFNEQGIKQIYLETNKGTRFKKGKEIGEKIDLIPSNKSKLDIIVGTFGTVENIGISYIDISDYIKKYFIAFSEVRMKINTDKNYKKQIEDKYKGLSEIDKYIYRTAILPDTPFTSILRYILAEIK